MRLAAHLCSSRCQEVIEGKIDFLTELKGMGFGRVQINATAGNFKHSKIYQLYHHRTS